MRRGGLTVAAAVEGAAVRASRARSSAAATAAARGAVPMAARGAAGPRFVAPAASAAAGMAARRGLSGAASSASSTGDAAGRRIQKGDRVSVSLKARDAATGTTLVDSSKEDPNNGGVSFVVGQGRVVPGLDKGLVGVMVGETWLKTLEPAEAFGVRDPDAVVNVPRREGDSVMAKEGEPVQLSNGAIGRIVKVTAEHVTIDLNHPLADRQIEFEVKVLALEEEARNRISGLHVETITPGDGKTFPRSGSRVTVHYTGKFAADDKEFDSSRKRGTPFSFVLGAGHVIRGWDVGVAKLSLGERANIFIPSELGYGSRGFAAIPPDADLVFDVELLKIE